MKKFLCTLTAIAVLAGTIRADEGMWMLPLLQRMNAKSMKELGCKLTPKQIYNINNSSLKSAVVQFGGGCTGEIVSKDGLLLTNHHCGYGHIQRLSSIEHDYLKDGFWAMNRKEELPCKGLTVKFLQSMKDITPIMEKTRKKALKQYKGNANAEKLADDAVETMVKGLVADAKRHNPHCDVIVETFYNDNVSYLIVYKIYKDIRFVGAPPSSIGKFGADTDNWTWPRHTGDFSVFRVYADKDNNPAEYSPSNVPLRTNNCLKISLNGVNEGDYTMIMGYPGRTMRFQTSPELRCMMEQNKILVEARTVRQNVLLEDMLADPQVKIQYANKYYKSSNGWKKRRGMNLSFEKLDIIGRAEAEEKAFTEWVNADRKRVQKYGNALKNLAEAAENGRTANNAYTLAFESIYKIEITETAALLKNAFNKAVSSGKDTSTALTAAYEKILPIYKDYSAPTDRKVAKAMLKFYRDNAGKEDYFAGLESMDIDSFVDSLYDNSAFTTAEGLKSAIESSGIKVFEDPAYMTAKLLVNKTHDLFVKARSYEPALKEARKLYTAGLLEWKKGEPSYPDANRTMRLTYGTVKGYSPRDAVIYRHYTTLDGVMEKENPESWEFIVPGKLKELWKNRDFGRYAMENGKMPVAFLSNNDITGGNSGSPIMNAKGELVGLAFDGNWESMSSDVMFEPDLQRCINVDIRYVLFIIDKFGGAGWLIDEMTIAK